MTPRADEYRVKAGSRAVLSLTITDSSNTAKSLSNSTTYATGRWKVWKPDGTLIINGAIAFDDRGNGVISYTLTTANTVIANAGVWEGEVELLDSDGNVSEQTSTFNFIIEESY
jgi:hypothetical protein